MSDLVLKDGRGTGQRTLVDSQGRLHTLADAIDTRHQAADEGLAFAVGMFAQELGAVDTVHQILWFDPTDQDRHFHWSRLILCWNGGNTTGNAAIRTRLHGGTAMPTTNAAVSMANNLNLTSTRQAEMDVRSWDGVGTGMNLGAGPAFSIFEAFLTQGSNEFDLQGGFICGAGAKIGVEVESPEIGKLTFTLLGFFEEDRTNIIR